MKNSLILVVYPEGFLCYKKFERKVSNILKSLANPTLAFFYDFNGYVKRYASENTITTKEILPEEREKVTHAIIFNDRETFVELIDCLKSHFIPTRVISLNLTIVVNKDRGHDYDVYIGRGSLWGNPYPIGEDDRDEVIRKFEYDFKKGFLKCCTNLSFNIESIRGKVLGCHCKPCRCHGDVIANYVNSIDDGL